MQYILYFSRFLLALVFVSAGIEKLFVPFDSVAFQAELPVTSPKFIEFYFLLNDTGYLYFVGFFQLLCGVLLVFRKTFLLGAVMLVPLLLCLLMTQLLIAQNLGLILFDALALALNLGLLAKDYAALKTTFLKSQPTLL